MIQIIFILLYVASSLVSAHRNLDDLDLYKIVWKGPPVEGKINPNNVINISTNANERFMCIVPDNDDISFDSSAKNSSSSEQIKSPIQILEPLLKANYCSYKFELFWTYELCHGKFLRQYHEENAKYRAKVTQEYYLGRIESEEIEAHEKEYQQQMAELDRTGQDRRKILIEGHQRPYVTFNFTGGTKCDLTKNDRIAKIIYVCNDEPGLELHSVKETSTCEYEAIVLSPVLCQHKDFRVDTTTQHEIRCYSLDGEQHLAKMDKFGDIDTDHSHENKWRIALENNQLRLYQI